ncbi:MAG: ATP-binding cassette domain-containing protein [Defluviitaleaceae bacterium]|nr:ATP-binding cassette domain-containing protein [Defluviitaleaceae bacterium]
MGSTQKKRGNLKASNDEQAYIGKNNANKRISGSQTNRDLSKTRSGKPQKKSKKAKQAERLRIKKENQKKAALEKITNKEAVTTADHLAQEVLLEVEQVENKAEAIEIRHEGDDAKRSDLKHPSTQNKNEAEPIEAIQPEVKETNGHEMDHQAVASLEKEKTNQNKQRKNKTKKRRTEQKIDLKETSGASKTQPPLNLEKSKTLEDKKERDKKRNPRKPKVLAVTIKPVEEVQANEPTDSENSFKKPITEQKKANLLPNSTWNLGERDWLKEFNRNRILCEPEADKPESHILHFPLGRGLASTISQPSAAIFMEANKTYTIAFDFKQDGIFVPNKKIMCFRTFANPDVKANKDNAKWDYSLTNDGIEAKRIKPLGITDLNQWYRITCMLKVPKNTWLRVIPFNNDDMSILGTSYREIMVIEGEDEATWMPHKNDAFNRMKLEKPPRHKNDLIKMSDKKNHSDRATKRVKSLTASKNTESTVKIELSYVTKRFELFDRKSAKLKEFLAFKKEESTKFWALKGITLQVNAGESLGIVGVNGSGKSTLSNIIAGVIQPTTGQVKINGEVSIISISSGLNRALTGTENIRLKLLMLGYKMSEIEAMLDDIVLFSELGSQIDQPLKSYSSGMKARLGFAIMIHMNLDIMIVDEGLSVGDATFKKKCEDKITEFKKQGKTFVIVSHRSGDIKRLCEKTAWIDLGELKQFGETDEVLAAYYDHIEWYENLEEVHRNQITTQKRGERITFNADHYYEKVLSEIGPQSKKEQLKKLFYGEEIVDRMSHAVIILSISLLLLMFFIMFRQVQIVLNYWSGLSH